ncbi:MAG: hypothetical protein N5P05_001260 [Chroococcopsis gigantea SAG 12.99]|nr:PEP-CTERM sorting domain-containing protein [Chlorogloea purpurea SAG 13.99]MDV2999654.1 hypothetical protein [Chroococcopsis gigantea SAG 12.99]
MLAPSAEASVIVTGEEVGGNVVFTVTGSIDISNVTAGQTATFDDPSSYIDPGLRLFLTTSSGRNVGYYPVMAQGEPHFGFFPKSSFTTITTGDTFVSIIFPYLLLDQNYVSGSPLNATATYVNATFSSLGIDPTGSPYVAPLINGETYTIQFTNTGAVPEPLTLMGVMTAVGFDAGFKRKLKR